MHDHLFLTKPLAISSQLLRGNPLGNPTERIAMVLEPLGGAAPRAVVYVLDGYFGSGRSMLNEPGALGRTFAQELLDYQIEGLVPPLLYVFADGSTVLGGSQYVNSTANGPFADHIVHEIAPAVESRWAVAGVPRAVVGHSSGGIGALWLTTSFPGFFQACIASAADSAFEYSLLPMFPVASMRLARAGSIGSFLSDLRSRNQPERCSPADFKTLLILALASCYSPAPGANESCGQLPFDLETLELDIGVWERWRRFDPVCFDDERLKTLRSLRLLMLDCGNEDEYAAQYGHRRLARRLRALHVPHVHNEFDGNHQGTRYRYCERLSLLAKALG